MTNLAYQGRFNDDDDQVIDDNAIFEGYLSDCCFKMGIW